MAGGGGAQFGGHDRAGVDQRVGLISQLARVDSYEMTNGPGSGTKRIRMVTGGGLDIEFLPDRALDIGHVTFRGVPLAWVSAVDFVSPHSYDTEGTEWLRSFGGGLLATCGLDTFGPPSTDSGVLYPMHGRVGAVPATVLEASLIDDVLTVRGEVRQAKVFSENLVLRRTYRAHLGGSTLHISDTVTNESATPAGHMMLYHFNLGWPLLDEKATLDIPHQSVTPRDEPAIAGLDTWSVIEPPQQGFAERVYFHHSVPGQGKATIDNPEINMRAELSFNTDTLPGLFQWKMADFGHFVMGLEPANTPHVHGRKTASDEKLLPVLQPGESVDYEVTLYLSDSHSTL
jgi:hypothetical protein